MKNMGSAWGEGVYVLVQINLYPFLNWLVREINFLIPMVDFWHPPPPPMLLVKLRPWEDIWTGGGRKEYGEQELIRNCSNFKDLYIRLKVRNWPCWKCDGVPVVTCSNGLSNFQHTITSTRAYGCTLQFVLLMIGANSTRKMYSKYSVIKNT
jgi:hypothetical protein